MPNRLWVSALKFFANGFLTSCAKFLQASLAIKHESLPNIHVFIAIQTSTHQSVIFKVVQPGLNILDKTMREPLGAEQEANKSTYHKRQVVSVSQPRSSLPVELSSDPVGHGDPFAASSTSAIDLQIVLFHRGYDVHSFVKPYHWVVLAAAGHETKCTAYQLRSMPGNFKYDGPEPEAVLDLLENRQQALDIGRIPARELKNLEFLLAHIPVSQVEHGYNCQTWTEDALKAMESYKWLDYSCSAIVQWLKQLETHHLSDSTTVNIADN